MIPDRGVNHVWRVLAIALFVACGLLHAACERSESATATPGKRRIVAVGGAVTETVFALGAGDEIVAVDTSSIYPPSVDKLPKVGYQRTLSAEGILAQSPDLVVASDEAGPPAILEQLRSAGVRVEVMPAAKTTDEAIARVHAVGRAIDRPTARIADQLRSDLHVAMSRATDKKPRFIVVYARGAGSMMVGGPDTSGSRTIELAGGRNAVPEITGWKPLSAEALIGAAPDVIVVPSRGLASLGGEAGLLATPGVSDTPAGKARKIVAIDDLLLLGFGPRLPAAIDELARALER